MTSIEIIKNSTIEFKKNCIGLVIATTPFIIGVVLVQFFAIQSLKVYSGYGLVFLTTLIGLILNSLITLVGLKYYLKQKSIAVELTKSKVFTYCFATLYISVASSLGYLFFVVPGILILCISFLYPIFIIKDGQGPIQAIGSSIELVKGHFKLILLVYLGLEFSIRAIKYIISSLFMFIAEPGQIFILSINFISSLLLLIYIPFMFVMYQELTQCQNKS